MLHERIHHHLQDVRVTTMGYTIILDYVAYEAPNHAWSSELHCHENWELHYITSGRGILKTNEEQYPISPGMLYITGPGFIHSQISDELQPMEEYCVRLTLRRTKKAVRSELNQLLAALEKCSFIMCPCNFDARQYVGDMIRECDEKAIAYRERLLHLCIALLIATARCINAGTPIAESRDNERAINRQRVIDDYLRLYGSEYLNINKLASRLHISTRHLRRIIHQNLGTTLAQQKNRLRIERAKQLLDDDRLTITEIAQELGFSSSSYFSRCFRSLTGMPPQEYRKKSKTDAAK